MIDLEAEAHHRELWRFKAALRRRAWKLCGCSRCERSPGAEERVNEVYRVCGGYGSVMREAIFQVIVHDLYPLCPNRAPELVL